MKLTASTTALALMAFASPAYLAKFGELGPAPPPPARPPTPEGARPAATCNGKSASCAGLQVATLIKLFVH